MALGPNNYRVIFGDTTTSVDQTNDFNFVVIPDAQLLVTPAMLSGPLRFLASPGGLFFVDPIPYGIPNNGSDVGWIWPNDNTGLLQVDFGQPTPLARFRVYSTYPGGARGAAWSIEQSDDGQTWTPLVEFPYETKIGGAIDETGAKRADTAGWYEISFNQNGAESHRYWRIRQSRVTILNAPRSAEVQFYSALPQPSLKSVAPIGRNVNPSATIVVELQDNITAVNPGSIQLTLNGQVVPAAVDKPAGSIITTLSYKPNGGLRSGLNTVRVTFANDATPGILQNHEFTFNVQGGLLDVYPSMLSGPLNFFASPAGLTFTQPIPYGIPNNVNDQGWIWPSDNSGFLIVDFGVPAVVQKFRAYTSYGGAGRGAIWAIEYSNDNVNWTKSTDFNYQNTAGGGVNEDGSARTDFGGWFGVTFNAGGVAARYWRISQTSVTLAHAPRTAQLEFSGTLVQPLPITPEMLSGTLSFFASPAGLTFADPIPYGIPNNVTDQGWIWPLGNDGYTWSGITPRFEVATAGEHVVNVWMRENGMIVDKLLITTDAAYRPTGTGPDESPLSSTPSRMQDSGATGLVVFEAEHFDSKISAVGTDGITHEWLQITTAPGFSGTGAMQALPNEPNLNAASDITTVPRMDYKVQFSKTGTQYIWVRGLGDSAPGPSIDDSLHVGLDGQFIVSSSVITGFPPAVPFAELIVDLGSPQALNLLRAYSSYGGAARGAIWTIERSDDNATWIPVTDFRYETSVGGGVNDDGSKRTDTGAWYPSPLFNFDGAASRYWRVRETAVTIGHSPRTAQLELYAVANLAALPLSLSVARNGAEFLISWRGTATLQTAATVDATQWDDLVGATSPVRITQPQATRFYRLKK